MVGVLFPSLLLPVKISLKIFIERKGGGEGGGGGGVIQQLTAQSLGSWREQWTSVPPSLWNVYQRRLSLLRITTAVPLLKNEPLSSLDIHTPTLLLEYRSIWCFITVHFGAFFYSINLLAVLMVHLTYVFYLGKIYIYKRYWFDLVSSWKKATKSTVRKLTDPCT